MRRTVVAAALALLALPLASCGEATSTAGEPTGSSGSSEASGSTAPPPGMDDDSVSGPAQSDGVLAAPSDVEARTDLTDLTPLTWERAETVDETHARIFFTGQNPRCYGVAVEVRESDSEVVVALSQGVLPDAPQVCPALAAPQTVVVATDEPIGDRPVVAPGR